MVRSGGQRAGRRLEQWAHARFADMGLYQLRGTVKYAAHAIPVGSSLSLVRENCNHGLKEIL
jgi:hypothetical protein